MSKIKPKTASAPRDPHDWVGVTTWKTWAHDWCSRCGTLRVTMADTGISFFNTPTGVNPCRIESKQ